MISQRSTQSLETPLSAGDLSAAVTLPPVQLTDNGRRVLEARYLRRKANARRIETPEEMFERVVRAVGEVERSYGVAGSKVDAIQHQLYSLMATGTFFPNSPTLMNAGTEQSLLSACFVIPVEDSVESIFSAVKQTALVQKAGGGTGFSFGRLRPKGDLVRSSGGATSGPISFMKVFSEATTAIQQGAFRRGANMGVMPIHHPDIIEFINAKCEPGAFSNFNISVAITDDFMRALTQNPDIEHITVNPRTGEPSPLSQDGRSWTVGELFELIASRAWSVARHASPWGRCQDRSWGREV